MLHLELKNKFMNKRFNIPVTERIQIFQVWLASINWTLGPNQLTEAELEIFSYLIYYNDKYKSVKEYSIRMDLLFSTTIKNKIKEEFGIPTHKLETYLNKLRKKECIKNNSIDERFIIYPDSSLEVTFACKIASNEVRPPVQDTPVEPSIDIPEDTEVYNEPSAQEPIEEEDDLDSPAEEEYDYKDPFDKYFNDSESNIESWM